MRISLAYRGPNALDASFCERYSDTAVELDLSYNAMSDFGALRTFSKLRTLVLSHNSVPKQMHFPKIATLETLWVNFCGIDNLAAFIDKVAASFPNLKCLSMLGNEACPNFLVDGGSVQQYHDYRRFVAARLAGLEWLDDSAISANERNEGRGKYGSGAGKTGMEKVLGRQKKKHSQRKSALHEKSGVVEGTLEHPYARKKELVIPGQSENPEDEWTTDEEDIDYWKGYVPMSKANPSE